MTHTLLQRCRGWPTTLTTNTPDNKKKPTHFVTLESTLFFLLSLASVVYMTKMGLVLDENLITVILELLSNQPKCIFDWSKFKVILEKDRLPFKNSNLPMTHALLHGSASHSSTAEEFICVWTPFFPTSSPPAEASYSFCPTWYAIYCLTRLS